MQGPRMADRKGAKAGHGRPDGTAVVEALGDPVDRAIATCLADRARPVKEIAEACDLSEATAYRHVNRLVDEGILFLARSGITEEGKRVDLYRCAVNRLLVTVTPDGLDVHVELAEDAADRLRRVWMDIRTEPEDEP